jgi:hypothetical protein
VSKCQQKLQLEIAKIYSFFEEMLMKLRNILCIVLLLGTGSVLNQKRQVEMDALIMDGDQLRAGSVAAVQNIANPVKLARMVMEKVYFHLLHSLF